MSRRVEVEELDESADQQYLPDGEGGSMEPEKLDELDSRIAEYLDCKFRQAECRESMKSLREEMIAIAKSHYGESQPCVTYRTEWQGKIYVMTVSEETSVSIAAAKTDD